MCQVIMIKTGGEFSRMEDLTFFLLGFSPPLKILMLGKFDKIIFSLSLFEKKKFITIFWI